MPRKAARTLSGSGSGLFQQAESCRLVKLNPQPLQDVEAGPVDLEGLALRQPGELH
jgi:hypothetical protein